MGEASAQVGIIMGSRSDWPTLCYAAETLAALEIAYEARVVSAHRTPERMRDYALAARERGLQVIIAGAGGAAHLPGMTAAMTPLPVFGVPVESKALSGQDSLLSIVQMPAGIPVGTLAIGKAGAVNAALLAAAVLALQDPALAERLDAWRRRQSKGVPEHPAHRGGRGRFMTAKLGPALAPGTPIGILGSGQLGRMAALAAHRLGYPCHIFGPEAGAPANQVTALATRRRLR